MGLPRQVIKLFRDENAHKKISGELLVCGKQTVLADRELINHIFADQPEASSSILAAWSDAANMDRSTRHSHDTLRDDVFLKAFLDVNYNCLAISNYEGANVICNLNAPVPDPLRSTFDFIYSGGCHDNVFSPSTLLINTSKMLKTNGRVVHYEACSGLLGAYQMFSAEWFYSYYAANNFKDCKVYVCHQTKPGTTRFDYETNLFLYQPSFSRSADFDYFKSAIASAGIMYLLVIAEKGQDSTEDNIPIQLQYLDDKSGDWRVAESKFINSPRPLLKGQRTEDHVRPFLSDHFHYLGSGF